MAAQPGGDGHGAQGRLWGCVGVKVGACAHRPTWSMTAVSSPLSFPPLPLPARHRAGHSAAVSRGAGRARQQGSTQPSMTAARHGAPSPAGASPGGTLPRSPAACRLASTALQPTAELVHSRVVALARPDSAAHVRQAVGVQQIRRLVAALGLHPVTRKQGKRKGGRGAAAVGGCGLGNPSACARDRKWCRAPQLGRAVSKAAAPNGVQAAQAGQRPLSPAAAPPRPARSPLGLHRLRVGRGGHHLGEVVAKGAARLLPLRVWLGPPLGRLRLELEVPGGRAGRETRRKG